MKSIIIRNFFMTDLDQLIDFFRKYTFHHKHNTSTPERIAKNLYLHSILNVPTRSLGLDIFTCSVAIVDGKKIAGAIIARRFPIGKTWVIGPVVIHNKFRRLQLATKIMNHLIKYLKKKKAKNAILSVEKNNLNGRAFFEKLGFTYLAPSFTQHSEARNYSRNIALVYGYLPHFWHTPEKNYSINRNMIYKKQGLPKNTRLWYILRKKL